MYLSQTSSHSDYRDSGVYVDVYDYITLPAGASGYFMVKGTITSEHQDSRTNKACIYLNNQMLHCEDVIYALEQPRGHIRIDKRVNKSEVNIGDTVTFSLEVWNDGQTPMTNFTVTDTFPSGLVFIGQHSDGFTFDGPNGRVVYWKNYQKTLQPGERITITFDARVESVGTHTNWVCITHPDFPNWRPDAQSSENCDPADVIGKEKPRCMAPEFGSSVLQADQGGRVSTTVTCRTNTGQPAERIEVLCGNNRGDSRVDYTTSSVSTTCEYDIGSSTSDGRFSPSCRVNGETMPECQGTLTIKPYPKGIGYCGDGKATDWEDCDCYDRSKNCSLSNANIAGRADNRGGNRCVNCKIE
jgi:uncharacterized repeat protein (TIGR01451 family)